MSALLCLLLLTPLFEDIGPPRERPLGEALYAAARSKNREGLKGFRAKDFPAALEAFRQAYDIAPRDSEITNNLAFTHQKLGNRFQALRFYRETLALDPRRAIAYINLADLLMTKEATLSDLTEAAAALVRVRELKGNQPRIILRQAHAARRRGRFKHAERFYRDYLDETPATDRIRLELGDFYREFDEPVQALRWYDQVGGEFAAKAAANIRALEVEREARRYGWTRGAAVPEAARLLVERGQALMKAHATKEARDLADRALRLAPQFADAHGLIARLYAGEGAAVEAELSYLRAIVLGSVEVDLFAHFAEWLTAEGRPAEAAFFLKRALQLDPDRVDLRAHLARAWQRVGDLPRALQQANRALAELPEDAPRDELLALKRALEANLPQRPTSPARAALEDASWVEILDRARAWLEGGEPGKALAEIRRLPSGVMEAEVKRLEGRVLSAVGRLDEALVALDVSLRLDPDDPTTQLLAGRLHLQADDEEKGRRLLEAAEANGENRAGLDLARLDARRPPDAWPIWSDLRRFNALDRATRRLRPLLSHGGLVEQEARQLLDDLQQRRRVIYSALIGLGLLLLTLAVGVLSLTHLERAKDLATLVTAHPETGPEVQRVLSAIRHEVLKHHTMALTGLVAALEADDPAAVAQAAWCRRSLLGAPGMPESGARARLNGYVEELLKIGRACGARLDLKRKDIALSALLIGFQRLAKARRSLDRVHRLSKRERRRLIKALRGAAEMLNVRGYEAVRGLLDRLRVLEVDEALLLGLFEQTAHEPAFEGIEIAPLALEMEAPCALVIGRADFGDVLQNLLRNALEASVEAGRRPARIGLSVTIDLDPITALGEAIFAVRDEVACDLDVAALRARPIESGLGLVNRLVARYEGRLDLWPAPTPWAKAIGVSLPLHEDISEEEESWV